LENGQASLGAVGVSFSIGRESCEGRLWLIITAQGHCEGVECGSVLGIAGKCIHETSESFRGRGRPPRGKLGMPLEREKTANKCGIIQLRLAGEFPMDASEKIRRPLKVSRGESLEALLQKGMQSIGGKPRLTGLRMKTAGPEDPTDDNEGKQPAETDHAPPRKGARGTNVNKS